MVIDVVVGSGVCLAAVAIIDENRISAIDWSRSLGSCVIVVEVKRKKQKTLKSLLERTPL